MQDLKGKVVLVTGGGRGLGEAICKVLGEAGATIVAADIRQEQTQKMIQQLPCEGMSLNVDVSNEEQVGEGIRAIMERFGRLDVLINNAGVDFTLSVEEISFQEWRRVVSVNLIGPFITSKHVFPVMRAQGGGHIVNIASTAAKRAWANASAYHASKWGLLGFSHSLLVEGREANIKVTAVVSGGMRTPFLLDRFPDIDPGVLQDPRNVAETIKFVLTQPAETVIPEIMVLPMRETSFP